MSEMAITVQAEAAIEIAPSARAQELDGKVRGTLAWMDATKEEAKHRIAALGTWLREISEKQLYRELGYPSVHRYMLGVVTPFANVKPTQLYACMSVAEHLLSHASPEQIERIGISNAYVLANAIRLTGRVPGEQLLLQAEALRGDEFRAAVAERFELREGEEKPPNQAWFDPGGFYVEHKELQEILYVIELVKRIDPVVKNTLPDHVQRKEVFLRMVHEIRATYESAEAREAP